MQQARLNGRYELLERLGEGGVAVVYRCQDTLLDRAAAVKVLRSELTSDPTFINRFRREAQAAARLNHPNIISIYDVGQDGDQYYIVMEQVEGQDLKAYLAEHAPLPVAQALGIAEQVAAALEHAHQQGLVHRDIKPQNILVAGNGGYTAARVPQVKVADFGLAHNLTSVSAPEGGLVLGTVQYISPEQARGEQATPASDIYSLGVVLYEMLTGRLPFESDTPVGLALKHIQEEAQPPSRLNPRLPAAIDALVGRAMAKDPAQRFASAADMGAAMASLREFGEQLTGRVPVVKPAAQAPAARPVPATARPAATQQATVRPAVPRPAAQRRGGFDWLLLILFLVTFMAIAGLVPLAYGVRDAVFPPAPTPPPQASVPNLVGLEQAVAESQLQALGLLLVVQDERFDDTAPAQRIIAQLVPAGTLLSPGQAVDVIVSRGHEKVRVPSLVGLTVQDAQGKLSSLRLGFEKRESPNAQVQANVVIGQDPPAETEVERGATVRLTVSVGDKVAVPNLIGKPEAEAQRLIREAGLTTTYANYQTAEDVPEQYRAAFNTIAVGSVVSSQPVAGTLVERGAQVNIAVRRR